MWYGGCCKNSPTTIKSTETIQIERNHIAPVAHAIDGQIRSTFSPDEKTAQTPYLNINTRKALFAWPRISTTI